MTLNNICDKARAWMIILSSDIFAAVCSKIQCRQSLIGNHGNMWIKFGYFNFLWCAFILSTFHQRWIKSGGWVVEDRKSEKKYIHLKIGHSDEKFYVDFKSVSIFHQAIILSEICAFRET